MALIAGKLNNASGVRPNTRIILTAYKTTSDVVTLAPDTTIVTSATGAYSFECKPSFYNVRIQQPGYPCENVGIIQVYPDSPTGTINDFLTVFKPDDLTPEILKQCIAAMEGAEAAQKAAEAAASTAAEETAQKVGLMYPVNAGNWSTVAGSQLTEVDRYKAWSYPDNSNDRYAVRGSVTLPITIPSAPDANWYLASSVNLTEMRTDSASQLGGTYKKDYTTGDVIPVDAMKDELMYWHNGRFYSVGTDAGFTSNDFNADLASGRFLIRSFTLVYKSYQSMLASASSIPIGSVISSGVGRWKKTSKDLMPLNGVYINDFELNGTDDTANIQIASDLSVAKKVALRDTGGTYIVDGLKFYAFQKVRMSGSGTTKFKAPSDKTLAVITHGGQNNMLYSEFIGFTTEGGIQGIKFDVVESVNSCLFDDVKMTKHSGLDMSLSQPLINVFHRVWWSGGVANLRITGAYCNANTWNACQFIGSTNYYINCLAPNEANSFNATRFEGNGGVIPADEENHQSHLHFNKPKSLSFNAGCYFERTHINTYSEAGSTNTTKFSSCHFTGAYGNPTGFRRQRMETDGIIQYDACDASTGTTFRAGKGRALLTGSNLNMFTDDAKYTEFAGYSGTGIQAQDKGTGSGTTRCVSAVSAMFPPGNVRNLFKFSRVTVDAGGDNQPIFSGEVTVSWACRLSGGFTSIITQRYQVLVTAVGVAAMSIQFSKISEVGDLAGGVTLTLGSTNALKGEVTLQAIFSSAITPTNIPQFQWAIDGVTTRTVASDVIIVDAL